MTERAPPATIHVDTMTVRAGASMDAHAATALAHSVATAMSSSGVLAAHAGDFITDVVLRLPASAVAANGSVDAAAVQRALALWRDTGREGGSHA